MGNTKPIVHIVGFTPESNKETALKNCLQQVFNSSNTSLSTTSENMETASRSLTQQKASVANWSLASCKSSGDERQLIK